MSDAKVQRETTLPSGQTTRGEVKARDFKTFADAIAFAIEQESRAQNFYLRLAEEVAHPWTKKAFREFAATELEHKEQLIKALSDGLTPTAPKYIQNLKIVDYVTGVIFPHEDMDTGEAYVLAMRAEQAAYLLYVDFANRAESEPARELFLTLARQEAEHRLRLETEYDDHVFAQN